MSGKSSRSPVIACLLGKRYFHFSEKLIFRNNDLIPEYMKLVV